MTAEAPRPRSGAWSWLAGCLVVALAAAAAICGGVAWLLHLPSEDALLAQFHEHRAELDELARMVAEDRLYTVRLDGNRVERIVVREGESLQPVPEDSDALPPARRARYVDLLEKAGIRGGLSRGVYVVGSQGSNRKALQNGFAPCPPSGVFVNSFSEADGFSRYREFFRRTDPPWCLVLRGGD